MQSLQPMPLSDLDFRFILNDLTADYQYDIFVLDVNLFSQDDFD